MIVKGVFIRLYRSSVYTNWYMAFSFDTHLKQEMAIEVRKLDESTYSRCTNYKVPAELIAAFVCMNFNVDILLRP